MAPERFTPAGNSLEFSRWREFMRKSRNGSDRPVANNTRVGWRGPDTLAFRLHNTDVVELRRDGSWTIRTGGWYTPTTMQRIRAFSPAKVESFSMADEDWRVRCEPDPKDPHPLAHEGRYYGPWSRAHRGIEKPFHAPEPGPEPEPESFGECIADTREEFEAWHERYDYVSRDDSFGNVERAYTWTDGWSVAAIVWGEAQYRWHGLKANETYKQCPHCKAFQRVHAAWSARDSRHTTMHRYLERFGGRDGWQDAYITEYRQVRETNREIKAWVQRNYWEFSGSLDLTPDGYVPLAWKLQRDKVRRQQARLQRQLAARTARRELQRKREATVRRQIAEAMAESIAVELTLKRDEFLNRTKGAVPA